MILGLVWGAAIWWPSQSAISSANEQLEQTQGEQLSLVAEIDRLNDASGQVPDLEGDLAAIARSIPGDPEIDSFLTTLAAAAAQNGVLINLVSPSELLEAGTTDANRPVPVGMTAVSVVLEAQGDFAEVMAFTSQLDQLTRLLVVDHIGMVAVDGQTQVIVIDLSLRIFAGGLTNQSTASATDITINPGDPAGVIAAANGLDGIGRERAETLEEEIE